MQDDSEDGPRSVSDLFEILESIGVNAALRLSFDDDALVEPFVTDALTQFVNIHEYAFYDDKFEPPTIDDLCDIITLNMTSTVGPDIKNAFQEWIGDVIVLLAAGTVDLDEFIDFSM